MSYSNTINYAFDMVKTYWHKIDLKKWSHNIGGSSAEAIHAALYFVLAFGLGFLLKKYFKYLISGFLIAIFAIKVLEYNKILTIDWGAIKTLSGVGSTADLNTKVHALIAWGKANIFLFGASLIGILLGYRLG